MPVTQYYKDASVFAVGEVGVAASEERAENDHTVNIAGASAINRAQMRKQTHFHIFNLSLGNAVKNDFCNLLGSRMYSNQDLSIIARSHVASKKLWSVAV